MDTEVCSIEGCEGVWFRGHPLCKTHFAAKAEKANKKRKLEAERTAKARAKGGLPSHYELHVESQYRQLRRVCESCNYEYCSTAVRLRARKKGEHRFAGLKALCADCYKIWLKEKGVKT